MKKSILFFWFITAFLCCKSSSEIITIKAFGEKPSLLREPYLQLVKQNSVSITWKTNDVAEQCDVIYYQANKKSIKKISKGYLVAHEGNLFNEVNLVGLLPDTSYSYEVYSNGHLLASGSSYYFTTAPNNQNKAFTFYALGDIGAKLPYSYAKEPANRIVALKQKPDFGLGLGDIVYPKGESENYDNQLFKPFENVFKNTPFYPVAGNHDWLSDPEKNFEKEWALPNNEHYYSFSYSNTLFIGLDSSDGGFYNFEAQVSWLKETLKNNKEKYEWIIVYLHHNGKTCSYKPDYKHVIELYKIFANSNVDLVLNGHAHTYERLKPYDENGNIDNARKTETSYGNLKNKFISITIGAGGKINKKWKANPNDPKNCKDGTIVAHAEHVPSFALIKVNGKILIFKGVHSFTGKVFDTFVMSKRKS